MSTRKGLDFEMTPEIMEQLQQHAIDRFGPADRIGRMRFIQGAEAAWDLAQKQSKNLVQAHDKLFPNPVHIAPSDAEFLRSFNKPTEDDERDARQWFDNEYKGNIVEANSALYIGFLAGRRGLREAVELAVKAALENCKCQK